MVQASIYRMFCFIWLSVYDYKSDLYDFSYMNYHIWFKFLPYMIYGIWLFVYDSNTFRIWFSVYVSPYMIEIIYGYHICLFIYDCIHMITYGTICEPSYMVYRIWSYTETIWCGIWVSYMVITHSHIRFPGAMQKKWWKKLLLAWVYGWQKIRSLKKWLPI